MVASLDQLGELLTVLDVGELVVLPRFTAEDAARWPVVLSERPRDAVCVVVGDHDADLSTTIGHPHTGDPQRWLDLCVAHATELHERYGYTIDTGASRLRPDEQEAGTSDEASAHPLATILAAAADGRDDLDAPPVLVLEPLPGPCDIVLFLPGHVVVAADLDGGWVREQHARDADHEPTDGVGRWSSFLAAVVARLGGPPVQAGLLTAASHRAPMLRGGLTLGGEPDPAWAPYRDSVKTYGYRSGNTRGHIDFGRGPAGRTEVYPRLRASRSLGGGPSREVVAAARSLAPDARHVFGSAPLDDVEAGRVLLDGAFAPVATEVLLLTRPRSARRAEETS